MLITFTKEDFIQAFHEALETSTLRADVNQIRADLDSLRADVNELKADVDMLKGDVKTLFKITERIENKANIALEYIMEVLTIQKEQRKIIDNITVLKHYTESTQTTLSTHISNKTIHLNPSKKL